MTQALVRPVLPVARRTWPGIEENIRQARHWVRAQLAGQSDTAIDIAVTVVSELATNAIKHTHSGEDGGRFTVHVDASSRRMLFLAVRDEGALVAGSVPTARGLGPCEPLESGRGLAIVAEMALNWDSHPIGDGRLTWATIAR